MKGPLGLEHLSLKRQHEGALGGGGGGPFPGRLGGFFEKGVG